MEHFNTLRGTIRRLQYDMCKVAIIHNSLNNLSQEYQTYNSTLTKIYLHFIQYIKLHVNPENTETSIQCFIEC